MWTFLFCTVVFAFNIGCAALFRDDVGQSALHAGLAALNLGAMLMLLKANS